jgi:serine/threonine protein kinase
MKDGVVYSKTDRSTVQARKNPLSPFLTVTPSKPVTQEKIDTLNAISFFAEDHPNLAVEIFAGYHEKGEYEGKQKFLRREIKNGFSLDETDKLNEYRRSGKITDKQLSDQFDILWSLLGKLKDQGLYHRDISCGNFILDTETNTVVLTDWMEAAKHPLYSIDFDQRAIKNFKNHFVPAQSSSRTRKAFAALEQKLPERVKAKITRGHSINRA